MFKKIILALSLVTCQLSLVTSPVHAGSLSSSFSLSSKELGAQQLNISFTGSDCHPKNGESITQIDIDASGGTAEGYAVDLSNAKVKAATVNSSPISINGSSHEVLGGTGVSRLKLPTSSFKFPQDGKFQLSLSNVKIVRTAKVSFSVSLASQMGGSLIHCIGAMSPIMQVGITAPKPSPLVSPTPSPSPTPTLTPQPAPTNPSQDNALQDSPKPTTWLSNFWHKILNFFKKNK